LYVYTKPTQKEFIKNEFESLRMQTHEAEVGTIYFSIKKINFARPIEMAIYSKK
jgi:hypothetical protein